MNSLYHTWKESTMSNAEQPTTAERQARFQQRHAETPTKPEHTITVALTFDREEQRMLRDLLDAHNRSNAAQGFAPSTMEEMLRATTVTLIRKFWREMDAAGEFDNPSWMQPGE
jgi:phage-related protein